MGDIKVMDTIRNMAEEETYVINALRHAPILFFAEAVAVSRREPGVSIEDIAKCFRHQFDEAELSALIHELNKAKL